MVLCNAVAFADCKVEMDLLKAKYPNPEETLINFGREGIPPDRFFEANRIYGLVSECGSLSDSQKSLAKIKFKEWHTNYYIKKAEMIATSGGDLDKYIIDKKDHQTIIDYIKTYGAEAQKDVSADIQRIRDLSRKNKNKYKNSCSTVDNRNTPCGKLLGKPRDQADLSWCFAFTTADLYSCKIGKKVSAADVAFQVNHGHLDEKDIFSKGTTTIAAIDKMKEVGVCLESDQPSELKTMSLLEAYQKIRKENERSQREGQRPLICSPEQSAFPAIEFTEFGRIVEATEKNLLEKLNSMACSKRYVVGTDTANQVVKKNPADFLKRMNSLIDSKKPFHISYEQALLYDGPVIQKENKETAYNHSSIIMGRRFNKEKNVCEFLIRNSYGSEQSDYMNVDHTQEEGHQWVNVEFLLERADNISYFD